jgi:hypothetical protein
MSPRDRRLEQGKAPVGSPAAKEKHRKGKSSTYPGKFKPGKDLPNGTVKQHRAKPGMTSPQ